MEQQSQSEGDVIGRAERDLRTKAKAVLAKPSSWKTFVISTYFVYSFNYLFLFICAIIYFDRVTALNEHCNDLNEQLCHADPLCHYKGLREDACVMGQPDFDFFLFVMGSWTLTTVTHLVKTYLAIKNLYRHKRAPAPQQLALNDALEVKILSSSASSGSSASSDSSLTSANLSTINADQKVGVTVTAPVSPANENKRMSRGRVARSDSFASLPGAINRAETGKYQGYTTAVMCCILPMVYKDWTSEEWGFVNRGQSRFLLITDFILDGLCGFIASIGYLSLRFNTDRVPTFPAVMALLCSLFILLYTGGCLVYWGTKKIRYWGPVAS